MSGQEVLISVPEAARRLGFGMTFTYRLIQTGELASVKVGPKSRRIPVRALDAFVAERLEHAGRDADAI